MRYRFLALALLLLLTAPAGAATGESWYTFRMQGQRLGWLQSVEREVGGGENRQLVVTQKALLLMRRGSVSLRVETRTESVADGELRPVRFRHERQQGGLTVTVTGERQGSEMRVTTTAGGSPVQQTVPLTDKLLLSSHLDDLLARHLTVGATVAGQLLSEDDGVAEPFDFTVRERTTLSLRGQDVPVFRVEGHVGAIGVVRYLTPDGTLLREVVPDMQAVTERSSRSEATRDPEAYDLFSSSLVRPRGEPLAVNADRAVLRLRLETGSLPELPTDERQQVRRLSDQEAEIHLTRALEPTASPTVGVALADPALRELLAATPYITTEAPAIRKQARRLAEGAADSWEAARRINRWVHHFVRKKSLRRAYASAIDTLRSGEGDCTEHAVLTAALDRSLGIPTRIVDGLVYTGEAFGFHEWVEVWVGRWVAMDPTFGQERADASHVALTRGVGGPEDHRRSSVAVARLLGRAIIDILPAKDAP